MRNSGGLLVEWRSSGNSKSDEGRLRAELHLGEKVEADPKYLLQLDSELC